MRSGRTSLGPLADDFAAFGRRKKQQCGVSVLDIAVPEHLKVVGSLGIHMASVQHPIGTRWHKFRTSASPR